MRKQIFSLTVLVLLTSFILVSCKKETSLNTQQVESSAFDATNNIAQESTKVYVSSVDELYAAVNDPANVGSEIILAPGTYLLNPNYPNAGRLELLADMSLTGQPGHPERVIMDATNLLASSRAVRMGNGKNSLEWLTLQNDPAHSIRSLVQTDIVATPVAQIRIAHTIIKGSSIGINIINANAIANGRIIEAVIEDNEIMNNTLPLFGAGIQIQNSSAVNDASIFVTLRRNYIHDNRSGIVVFNASTQRCVIDMNSDDDNIQDNGIGILLNGGFIQNSPALNNLTKFDAYGTTIKNNTGSPSPQYLYPACGVYAAGAESFPPFALPGEAHYNKLDISFHGCVIEDNAGSSQIIGYGGHSFHPLSTPAGTYNATNIYLDGISTNATVNATPSFPTEPAGTNTINVYK